jgi:subtilisin family serine protease
MSALGRIVQPWAHRAGAYALPNSLLVRMKLGEVPAGIPTLLDVRRKAARPAQTTGHDALDRVARTFGGTIQVSRLHGAARALRLVGQRHRGYAEDEEISGISRVLRFDVAPGTHVGSMAVSLMQLGVVESAMPNYLCTVGLDRNAGGRGDGDLDDVDGWQPRDMINARTALAYCNGDPTIIIGFVDSGINPGHVEFDARLRQGFDTVQLGAGELAGGVKLLGDNRGADTDPTDRFVGHGTGCAGIIGGEGVGMPPGVAGACRLLPIRSLGSALLPGHGAAIGVGALSDLDMGLVMAVQLGASVINCSFGTDDEDLEPGAPKPHAEAVAFAAARDCALVAASGNSGDARIYWPAAYPQVIAVGAVGPDRAISSFTTRGDHVALCAPGERVLTAALDGYQRATGTSFAAPFVTGVAGLLVARARARAAGLDPATLKSILMASAAPHRSDAGAGCGTGVLDAARALEMLDQALDADESTDSGGADDG